MRRIAEASAVLGLLALHGWLALSSSAQKSATFDEIAHLGGGTLQWVADDYRFNAESGVLLQRWATWPLADEDLKLLPPDHPARRGANVWILGREILYGEGHNAQQLLRSSRMMIVWLSVALGVTIFCGSRALFGRIGGLLSLTLYAFSPTMLAHARWVTSDLAAALFFLLASGAIWRLLERLSPARFAAAALATAGLLLSKMSGLLILPITVVLLAVRWARRRRLTFAWGSSEVEIENINTRRLMAGTVALAFAMAVLLAIWAAYGFRYSAQPDAPTEGSVFLHSWKSLAAEGGISTTLWQIARHGHFLPEAYVWGLAYTLETTRDRDAFLRGETRQTGWWWFFPYAVLIKTPLALFGLLALAAASRQSSIRRLTVPLSAVPLWALLAVYWLVAISSDLNIGHRHMLPTYPPLFILAGAAGRWIRWKSPIPAVAVSVCLAFFIWESVAIRPHYLSYFNQLIGGPANGYRHLVDSSLDWGQDLPGLATHIEGLRAEDSTTPVYAAYFGAARPDYYGIQPIWLSSYFPQAHPARVPGPLRGGVYYVSATLLRLMHLQLSGKWSAQHEQDLQREHALMQHFIELSRDDAGREQLLAERSRPEWIEHFETYDRLRSGRLFRFLATREPDTRIGYSIHVYQLSDADIHQAMNGPVPTDPSDGS